MYAGGEFDTEGLWIPYKGLGMAFVIEWLNRNLTMGKHKFIEGVDLSDYKETVDKVFEELEKIESTRKKWYKE